MTWPDTDRRSASRFIAKVLGSGSPHDPVDLPIAPENEHVAADIVKPHFM
jgi:hypothetical protein